MGRVFGKESAEYYFCLPPDTVWQAVIPDWLKIYSCRNNIKHAGRKQASGQINQEIVVRPNIFFLS